MESREDKVEDKTMGHKPGLRCLILVSLVLPCGRQVVENQNFLFTVLIPFNAKSVANEVITIYELMKDKAPDFACITEIRFNDNAGQIFVQLSVIRCMVQHEIREDWAGGAAVFASASKWNGVCHTMSIHKYSDNS